MTTALSESITKPRSEMTRRKPLAVGCVILAVILTLIGVLMTVGGMKLALLGGSWFYLTSGVCCLVTGWMYLRVPHHAALGVLVIVVGSTAWAVWEVKFDFWQLVPRVAWWVALLLIAVPHSLWLRRRGGVLAAGVAVCLAGTMLAVMRQLPMLPTPQASAQAPPAAVETPDWAAFGGSAAGTRYSTANQITPFNVGELRAAWVYRTGDIPVSPGPAHVFEATPILIGDMLYACTSSSVVMALDPDNGAQRWRFDTRSPATGVRLAACRGVSFYKAPAGTLDCPTRIIVPTRDGRLFELNAATGEPCQSFGTHGVISLLDGLGAVTPGFAYTTSPPAVIRNTIVLGSMILDGYATSEPAGVIRGFDARSGALRWAWDPGAAEENPKPGVEYSRGSPNAWSVLSADEELGLVYVPTGNATPDFVDQHRSPLDDRYASAVVALDVANGSRRWSFQTVHHDVWDYDVGSQPVLFEMPTPGGGSIPALAQATKQGDIYILDRRTGVPITSVTERPAPRGSVPGEIYAPTQPYSTGFPTLSPPTLQERDMWGATPLDQLWCRIRFRSLDYQGKYTPPALVSTLQYPGNFGVVDWGSVSIDPVRQLMIVNSSYMPMINKLLPRRLAPPPDSTGAYGYYSPQLGTPFAADPQPFLSPLGIPCNAPPWGRLTAIDLGKRQIRWQQPFGTTQDIAPLKIAISGAFNIGGAVSTASGLTFIAAAIDAYLRAFDTQTGRELWRGRLPAGGQAGAMTYISPKTHRQYVVVAAGGHQLLRTGLGDYLQAFALPVAQP